MTQAEIINYIADRFVAYCVQIMEAQMENDEEKSHIFRGAKAALYSVLSECFDITVKHNIDGTVTFKGSEIYITKDIVTMKSS